DRNSLGYCGGRRGGESPTEPTTSTLHAQVRGGMGRVQVAEAISLLFAEYDDAISICALGHVFDPPTIGGFCEVLIIDYDEHLFKSSLGATRQHRLLKPGFAAMPLSHFEGNMAARLKNPVHLTKNLLHCGLPVCKLTRDGEPHRLGLYP